VQRNLIISVGSSRKETKWIPREVTWPELMARLGQPTFTGETVAEYKKMPKPKQDDIKDIGGMVGGKLRDGVRKNSNVEYRSVLTLDLDFAQPDTWDTIQMFTGVACCIYSTHKHTSDAPRLRLCAPLARDVIPDEYAALGHKFAGGIDIELFDDTTFEAARLMYWSSTSSDGEHVFESQDGSWLDPDEILAQYQDWTDASSWPVSSRVGVERKKSADKQGDPLTKKGVVGTFSRAYTISEAIETFLPEVYVPCDGTDDRFTYLGGSTAGGLVVYDNDTFAFSHHATDPISGKLVNAFDLVRTHLFGVLDEDVKENTPPGKWPSFVEMTRFAKDDPLVQELDYEDRMEAVAKDFQGEKVNPKKLFFKEDKFNARFMAEWFMKRHQAFVMNDELYIYADGVYFKDERVFNVEGTAALADEFTTSRMREALAYIKNTVQMLTPEEATDTGMVLNLKNGLLDLITLEIKPHTPDFKTIVQLPVVYDPNADCAAFDKYLKMVVPHDTIAVIEEFVGYCLIPTMRYEKSLVLHGEGGNGKGTLISLMTEMLGVKNIAGVAFQTLSDNRFAAAELFGKMANLHADIPNKTIEDTALFKQITSGDMVQAEEKHKSPFKFRNRAKLIYSANEPPTSRDNTEGFHRKLLMVPFNTKFTDRDLRALLFTPEGLSALLLRGLKGMQRLIKLGKFTESATVTKSLVEYRNRSDNAAHFFEECCTFDAAEMTGKQALYDAYRAFCTDWGHKSLSQTRFNTRLLALHPDLKEYHQSGPRYWKGVKLENREFLI